jgi:maltoporin
MKITSKLFVIVTIFFSVLSQAELDYRGYMRAPVATNSSGGKQITLNNPGSQGNEFRLGNETGYGEASFINHFGKVADKANGYFDAHLTFAYAPPMNSQYGDQAPVGGVNTGDGIQYVEAYAKGGNFDGIKMSYWAGKRFYRDGDVHMNDFFYFADMSGNGGGIEDLEIGNGTLSFALLQYVDDRTLTNTTTGHPSKKAFDFRWRNFAISDKDKLEFWVAPGYTAPGKGTTTTTTPTAVEYQASSGVAGGVKWTSELTQGTNNFAVVYGTGVMQSLSLNNSAYALNDNVKKANRLRLVENYSTELNEKWAIQAAAAYELADSGNSTKSSWTSLGVRPMYYFTDHFRLQVEAGYSVVNDEAEVAALGGAKVGNRSLTRLTLAPEISFGKGYYSRPVVRFFVTHSMWNDANKDLTNANSMIAKLNAGGLTSLNNKNDETQMGFEAEVWF